MLYFFSNNFLKLDNISAYNIFVFLNNIIKTISFIIHSNTINKNIFFFIYIKILKILFLNYCFIFFLYIFIN